MSRHAPDALRRPPLTAVDLQDPGPPPSRSAARRTKGRRARRRDAAADRRADRIDWRALEPRGVYPVLVRPAAETLLVLGVLPLALALALPIALVNWCVFKDPRLVLFSQQRVGRRGRVFEIRKLRTMKCVPSSSFDSWSGEQDAVRVTRFGRLLRNSHLDELPQLLNVLAGDMSLIGPRPEMVEIEDWAAAHVPGFSERLAVKPGITGWPQITQGYVGRSVEGYATKHALAMRYLERFGPRQDLEILVRTLGWMARRKGWRWKEQAASAVDAPATADEGEERRAA